MYVCFQLVAFVREQYSPLLYSIFGKKTQHKELPNAKINDAKYMI